MTNSDSERIERLRILLESCDPSDRETGLWQEVNDIVNGEEGR